MFINKKSMGRNIASCLSSFVLILLLAAFFNAAGIAAHRSVLQQGIAEEVVRFHILANSDSEEDQNVKYQVRDAVLEWIFESGGYAKQSAETDSADRDTVLRFLSENLEQIEEVADRVLEEEGYPYHATAEIVQSYFPDRTYGDCTFPAGWYEALRIRLGDAKGRNWWCLLYPGLCFSDCLHAVIEDDEQIRLEEVLTAEEYESLLSSPEEWKISFKWF
ncbi:MAG: stage II sporulation protein R [Lachnospiraceae bacterium]|nr:stage II sporulation protein R [Lachnospiraceae bacterium]